MPRQSKYTAELLGPIVRDNQSMAGVLRDLGLRYTGGNFGYIAQRINAFCIDTDHFTGQGWAKGKTLDTDERIAHVAVKNRMPDGEVFRKGSTYPKSKIGYRLMRLGWERKCAICGIDEWLGQPLTCHVDHINGDTSDNRLENLRFICPNCHQQTETWGSARLKKPPHIVLCLGGCGKAVTRYSRSGLCTKCAALARHARFPRKVEYVDPTKNWKVKDRPSKDELADLMERSSWEALGRMYGVSGDAVRKWAKTYGLLV